MIMPSHKLPHLLEGGTALITMFTRPDHGVVVEPDERALQSRDDQVLVVPRVGDDGRVRPVVDTRQVLEQTAEAEPELVAVRWVVELWARDGPVPVDGVEVERRRPRGRRCG